MRARKTLAAATLACVFMTGYAAEKINDYDVGERLEFDRGTWEELKAQLPPYPKPENFIEVQAGPVSSHHYYIDASSLTLGKDGVMRYSAIVKTSGGATNVTFEGIRCDTRERKIYAVGHADGKWAESRDPAWRRIERYQPPFYLALWRDYFCPERTLPTPPKRAVEAIRRGTPLASGPSTSY